MVEELALGIGPTVGQAVLRELLDFLVGVELRGGAGEAVKMEPGIAGLERADGVAAVVVPLSQTTITGPRRWWSRFRRKVQRGLSVASIELVGIAQKTRLSKLRGWLAKTRTSLGRSSRRVLFGRGRVT